MDILNALLLLASGIVGLTIGSGWFQPITIGKQKRNPTIRGVTFFNKPTWLHFGTGLATLILAFMVWWDLLTVFSLSYNFGLAMWQISVFQLSKR